MYSKEIQGLLFITSINSDSFKSYISHIFYLSNIPYTLESMVFHLSYCQKDRSLLSPLKTSPLALAVESHLLFLIPFQYSIQFLLCNLLINSDLAKIFTHSLHYLNYSIPSPKKSRRCNHVFRLILGKDGLHRYR